MTGIINAFKTIINFFTTIFDIVMGFFETIVTIFRYLLTIVNLAFTALATLPSWLQAFAVITVSLSIAYFVMGRSGGKSDK